MLPLHSLLLWELSWSWSWFLLRSLRHTHSNRTRPQPRSQLDIQEKCSCFLWKMSLPLQPSKLHASTSVNSGQVPPFSAGWTTVLVFVLFPPPQLALHSPSSHLLTLQSTKNNFNHWILWQRWFDFSKFQLDMISCLWSRVFHITPFFELSLVLLPLMPLGCMRSQKNSAL